MSDARRRPGPARRLAALLAFVLGAPLALGGSLAISLAAQPSRDRLCAEVERQAAALLRGRLRVGRCSALGPNHVRLEDVALLLGSAPVLALRVLELRPEPLAFGEGVLHLREARLEGARVSLREADGELALLRALAPRDPTPAAPSEEPLALPAFRVDALVARDLALSDLEGLVPELAALRLRRLEASGAGAGPRAELQLQALELEAEVALAEEALALTLEGSGELALGGGGTSDVALHLRAGDSALALGAQAVAGEALEDLLKSVRVVLDGTLAGAEGERLGLPPVPLSLYAEAEGPLTAPRLEARLGLPGAADALALEASASLDDAFAPRGGRALLTLGGEAGEVDLRPLAPDLPPAVGGALTLTLTRTSEEPPVHPWDGLALSVEGRDLRAGGVRVPSVSAAARGVGERVVLDALDLPYLRGRGRLEGSGALVLAGEGRGDASVVLALDVPSLAADPTLRQATGLDGRLAGELEARLRGEAVDVRVDLEGEGLALPGARVARVGLAGFVRGALGRPEVDLRAGVERVALPGEGTVLRGLDLHVRGGPRQGSGARYALTLDTRAPAGRRATLEGALRLERPLTAAAPAGVASLEGELEGLWPSTLRVAARELRFRGDALSLEALEVRAARGPLALDAAGSLRGDLADARLSLVGLDARELLHAVQRAAPGTEERLRAELGGLPTGRLELEARVSGRPSAPDLEARLAGTGVIVGPLEVPRFELRAAHRSLERGARAEALVDVAAAGIGTLTLEASLASTRRRLAGLLRDPEARVDARLLAPGVDLQELAERANELGAGLPPLGGVVVLDGAVGGALGGLPDGRVAARAVALRVDYGDPVDLQADVDLGAPSGAAGEEPVRLRASARDRLGELFRGDVAVDVAPLLRGAAFAEALERVPFALRATLSERRADELPRPFAPALAVRASADVELSAEEGAPVQGRVTARAAFLDAACEGVETPPELDLSLALGEARGELVLRAALAGEPAFAFRAEAPAPLRRWVGMGGPAEAPPLSVRGGGRGVPLEHVPVLCEDAAGTLDLTLDAAELGSSEPRVALQATARGARVRGAAPILVGLQAALSGAQADLDVRIVEGERPALTLVAAAPLRTPAGVPELDPERPWSLSLDADAAPFAPLVAAVPDVVDPSGALDGALRVGGTGATVTDASGELRFDAVAFTIREPFQRIQRLDGGLALRDADAGGRGLVFEGLRIRDRDGSASLDGRIDTDASFRPRSAGLTLEMRRFPVRDEGIPIAYVDATARLDAEVREGLAQARVRMRNAAVAVPPDEGRVALGLAGHPDVTYEDEPGFGAAPFAAALPELEAPPDEREEEDDDALPHRLVLRFESSPFFVRRDDFAIQLEPDVTVRADAERATVGGPVIVRRGYLELLGKRFELQRGEILFTGSAEIDPELDLTARHELGSDETVGVRITGTLVRPELAFTSSEEGLTEQEILDRLVRGRQSGGADQTANDQARSVLAGLTAGFLSQIARRRFGSYVPVLAIESDGTNQAQVRAGFSLDRLIPRWLEPVLEGVYVEGVFGVEGEGEDAEQTGASFSTSALIELLFPRRFVGTAVVDQQANWSIDVTWEP